MDILETFWELVQRILVYHIVPAVILSSTTLLLVLGIIRLCRIERPSLRGILLFIPLLKPLIVLIQGTFPAYPKMAYPISVGLRFPDPMHFIPAHLWQSDTQLLDTNMRVGLIIIFVVVGLFLWWHWRSYYSFCRGLAKQSLVGQKKRGELFSILTQLRDKISTSAKLLITRTAFEGPFCIGVRDPIIVIPSYILAHLSPGEKKAVLAHELMHIYQKDTLRQWVPVILKDLLVFSPFAHLSFARIYVEREKRIDRAVANYFNDSTLLASALLKVAKLMTQKKIPLPMAQSFLTQKFLKSGGGLAERLRLL